MCDVPALRFPEFTGEWKFVHLKDVAEFQKKRISSDLLNNNNYISTENILQNFEGIQYSSSIPTNTNVIEYQKGDILLSNIRPYLKKVWFSDRKGGCSADVFVLRGDKCDQHFLYYVIASDRFINYVMSGVKGVKMPRGDKSQMEKYAFSIPTNTEQRKIAKFLSMLDERIKLQNKIIEDLRLLRDAISVCLLSPKSDWKCYKVSEIADIGRGRVISSKEIANQNNPQYPVYSSQTSNEGVMGYLDNYAFDGEYITWTTDGANAGTVFYRNGRFNCTNVCGTLKLHYQFDAYYCSLVLANATKKYVSVNLANPKLMNNTMAAIKLYLPPFQEQKRMAQLFRKMDENITLEHKLLLSYQKQKHYLLQQMFI
ncbi:restriction endonuclease subunit S [Bacteroides thetaiotaomicron]|uniref:restriction endonuclease subunit S n=2 Tax=Bacteroidales TaxID=171549 RepID=UPI0028A4BC63|nr:restriction endonuclease subunit S [Bacteroides thetaiotaomicron]MDT4418668.1 restriction endonuclease subunit S [Bacteroides thetaiotaomicron]